jgi:hypothetical protein
MHQFPTPIFILRLSFCISILATLLSTFSAFFVHEHSHMIDDYIHILDPMYTPLLSVDSMIFHGYIPQLCLHAQPITTQYTWSTHISKLL